MTKTNPTKFTFTQENLKHAKHLIAKYPPGKQASAVLPLLDLAQRQNNNWLSQAVLDYVADFLQMYPIQVYEVANFYSLFNLKPVGQHIVQVCTTTSCWLRGCDDIVSSCEKKLALKHGQTSADQKFTLRKVECLGACVNAPVVQINDTYYENLTPEGIEQILERLKQDKPGETYQDFKTESETQK